MDAAWQELGSCPGRSRMLAIAGPLNGTFYVAGGTVLNPDNGKVERTYLRDAWSYRPGHGWHRLADLPKACSAGATPAPRFDSTLYLIGGDDGSLTGLQPIEKHPGFHGRILAYHTRSDAWSIKPEAPFPSATVRTAFWRGRFVLAGGEPRPGVRSSQVWALALSGGKGSFDSYEQNQTNRPGSSHAHGFQYGRRAQSVRCGISSRALAAEQH